MSWKIGSNGFVMTLSARVPELIKVHLRGWLESWLQTMQLKIGDIGAWAVHPGGSRIVEAVGVVAVELFHTRDGLVINEIALRPHNTGHWTIEGALTSQFTNHLLAVRGAPLGPADAIVKAAAMVNVVGGEAPGSLHNAQLVIGAHVHDYGKSWRPGRKLGHVTVVGDDLADAHVRAWESARAYGTRTQEA